MIDPKNKVILLKLVSLTLVILAVYANSLNHGFLWDDTDVIATNSRLTSLKNIFSFFSSAYTVDALAGYYRPLTYVSFLLDHSLWGLNPLGFAATNIILHILVTLALYLVVSIISKTELFPLCTALIFSLHPIANETINFLSGGRNTLLCALFALLSLFFHMQRKQSIALTCFILSIFSKEFALLLPVVFLFHDRYFKNVKLSLILYLPYLAAIVGYLAIRAAVLKSPGLLNVIEIKNLLHMTPRLVIGYLSNMLFPYQLKTMYEIKAADNILQNAPFFVMVLSLIAVAIYFRKRREILLGVGWFLLFLIPVSGVLHLGITSMADRYAYFSLMGFAIVLSYLISLADKKFVFIIMLLLCGWYATIDIQRTHYWKDELSLFSQMIKDAPQQAIGYHNLSLAYYEKGEMPKAVTYASIAYTKEGTTAAMLAGSGTILREAQQFDKAKIALNLAGEKLLAVQKIDLARQQFLEVLRIDPFFVPALIDMGILSGELGDWNMSLDYFTRAAALDSSNPVPHYNLSKVLESLGKTAESANEMVQYKRLDAQLRKQESAVHSPLH